MDFVEKERYDVSDLRRIIEVLRSENGCPWDRAQDHHSVRKNMLEETYEVLEAIDNEDAELLREELGDVLMQVVFHARMEEEAGSFDLDDVVTDVCKKLVLRHPHVFGSVQAENEDEALKSWEAMKKEQKQQTSYTETLEAVPKVLPALMRAEKVLHRASRAGVKSPDSEVALTLLEDAIAELFAGMEAENLVEIEQKMGDILFQCVNISGFFHFDCEKLLTNATETFINRFKTVEQIAVAGQIDLAEADAAEVERLWKATGTAKTK